MGWPSRYRPLGNPRQKSSLVIANYITVTIRYGTEEAEPSKFVQFVFLM